MNQTKFTLHHTTPFPLGVRQTTEGYRFSFVSEAKENGVVLFSKSFSKPVTLLLDASFRCGKIYGAEVIGSFPEDTTYLLLQDGERVLDPCATGFWPKRKYMEQCSQTCLLPGKQEHYDIPEGPHIPFGDKVFYMLHPRGFSMKAHGKPGMKGTFAGITEALPYMKKLGVTSLILMPSYEFGERMESFDPVGLKKSTEEACHDMNFDLATYKVDFSENKDRPVKTNYWGYTADNQYFAVKGSYAMGDPDQEFGKLVAACHEEGMELFLQIYFPENSSFRLMEDVLLHWKLKYGVDGFHLMGATIPVQSLMESDALLDTYLLFENVEESVVAKRASCGVINSGFMYDMRNFLKGDYGVAFQVAGHIRRQMSAGGAIHFMAKQDTMRLADMVSYQEKHNLANGEDNRDGTNYNCSWNCGVEGKTRKKQILSLRKKQMKNAMCLLFLSQGTPLLYSGDEFGNSQDGNNNPYCQDNEISYIKWSELSKHKELFEFTKALICLRNTYPILKGAVAFQGTDYGAYGIPDISFHGKEAWRTDSQSLVFGVMYNNQYAIPGEDSVLYVAYNMHWEKHSLALPKLPGNRKWTCILSTDENWKASAGVGLGMPEQPNEVCGTLVIPERTIMVLKA